MVTRCKATLRNLNLSLQVNPLAARTFLFFFFFFFFFFLPFFPRCSLFRRAEGCQSLPHYQGYIMADHDRIRSFLSLSLSLSLSVFSFFSTSRLSKGKRISLKGIFNGVQIRTIFWYKLERITIQRGKIFLSDTSCTIRVNSVYRINHVPNKKYFSFFSICHRFLRNKFVARLLILFVSQLPIRYVEETNGSKWWGETRSRGIDSRKPGRNRRRKSVRGVVCIIRGTILTVLRST